MAESFKKNFYIYKKFKVLNTGLLNSAGKMFLSCLGDILSDAETVGEFFNNVDSIFVTSQDRTERNNNHNSGSAIDITVYPLGMNLWLIDKLSKYKYTAYISTYNRHIHFDLRTESLYGCEILVKDDRMVFPESLDAVMSAAGYNIRIDDISKFVSYLGAWYRIEALQNLKLKIIYRLNNPFIGTKKFFESVSDKMPKILQSGINWFLIGGAGVLAYMLLKNNKSVIIWKGKK